VLALPGLTPPPGSAVIRSPAAAALATAPIHPYVGPVPGGGLDGEPAVVYAGRLLPSDDLPGAPFATFGAALMGSLAGAEPIGLVGHERGWLAILHNPLSLERLDPSGGFVGTRIVQPAEAVSLAPVATARTPEVDAGSVQPAVVTAEVLPSGELGVGPGGFVATVEAPIGSRIYVTDPNGRAVGATVEIDGNGRESAILGVPEGAGSGDRFRASLSVVTPAGHGYVARWNARLLAGPPRLELQISTPFAASTEVRGHTAPYATVTVAGEPVTVGADGTFATSLDLPPWPTDIRVVATDPIGNTERTVVSAIGLFDYRGLPWLAIVGGLVAAAAVILLLRVPRANPFRRGEEDDAVLEELESD
jgi:hypothetical protein